MSRHVADRRKSDEGGRLKNYVAFERTAGDAGTHPATRAVHGRPSSRSGAVRLREFARIERGHTV